MISIIHCESVGTGSSFLALVSVEVMAFKHLHSLLSCTKYLRSKQNKATHLRLVLYNSCSEDSHEEEPLPFEWYEKPFRKSLARAFLGSPTMQQVFKSKTHIPPLCFGKPSERWPMTVSSLTKVSSFLNVSAQPRKSSLGRRSPTEGTRMGQQIVAHYLKFLHDSTSFDLDSTSWMRLSPAKFSDSQLEAMKEGLLQIKDVFIDKNIGYKETRYQESLVQKKLTKASGHPSQCLFTLLQFYLNGNIEDMEIEICGGVYDNEGKDKFCLCMGNILTSNEEKMVHSGVKQLDRL
ncbi:hypothetical protein Acr_00g0081270 [Actinidia rufa]|uniref:Uncharacterized protein n=1 Tax=Actinidia rufa TaxID=165716 RepID=A0A7J0DUX3_9ERIC|nr:hypothetical protein Acr_00g0081270 [Actinidia rufa]